MPTPTTYTYSIQNDFPNHAVAPERLTVEIRGSAIITALDSISTYGDNCNILFKDVLSNGDQTILNGLVAIHTGVSLPNQAQPVQLYSSGTAIMPTLADGRIRISAEKTSVSTVTFYSHNWCDKTTWYEKATRVVNEAASDSGDHITYILTHQFVIDSYHGKYTNEDYIKSADGYSYRVAVSVDGYAKTEQDPHYGAGGHFTVNYNDGYIIFLTSQNPASVVNVTYYYAGSSVFTVKPSAGKALRLGNAEAQFSDDVIVNDSVLFQPYGFVEAFAPQYCTTNGGPYPPGTKIPLGAPLVYKSIQDYLNDSKKSFPTYPALGGSGWRGMQRPSIILDWEYEGDKILRYDQGMEIRVYLQHNSAFGGNYGTVTFYCRSENLT